MIATSTQLASFSVWDCKRSLEEPMVEDAGKPRTSGRGAVTTEANAVNITNLDNQRLIREGEAAVDLYNKDIRSARARIMPMARGLAAAKREYPATQEFRDWLQTSSY